MEGLDLSKKLERVKGKELKYKQLCQELNIEYKRGNAKTAQLKTIALYCDLRTIDGPTRFMVNEVYDNKLLIFNGNTRLQEEIESVIIDLLRLNDFNIMYMTNTQLLMSLYMVNNNYKVLKIPKLRKALERATGEDYYGLYLSANKSGEILIKWVDRALERMAKRKLISYHKGFCLFKEHHTDEYSFFEKYEVPISNLYDQTPTMEQRVGGCYNQALESFGLGGSGYVPPDLKFAFNERFNSIIKEEFNGAYDGAYKVKIIIPSDPKRVKRFNSARTEINQESQKKIKETKQLDYLTGVERKRLLDEIIAIAPSVKYKELIEGEKSNELF